MIMTKRILSILFLASLLTVPADAQVVAKKSDATGKVLSGNVYFSQNGSDDSWSVVSSANNSYNASNDISNYQGLYAAPKGSALYEWASFTPPTYADNYTSIGSWAYRSKWNLANIHDPSVMLAEDGYYYMYCTDAGYGNPHESDIKNGKHGHFQCRRSKDLVNWEYMGGTMYGVPSWIKPKLNEIRLAMGLKETTTDFNNDLNFGYWAPCARKVRDGLYRMYYCIVCPGYLDPAKTSWVERAFIGLMETTDPSDLTKWEDKGYVVTNYSDKPLSSIYVSPTAWESCYYKYNAIDPSYIITPEGEHWLIYGSWHSGFAAVQLDPATGKTIATQGDPWGTANEAAYGKRVYTRKKSSRWQGSEAPEVIYRDGYYYLFMAYDALDVPYNTRVVRSKNIDGPYYTRAGANVTTNGGDAYPIITHPYKFGTNHGWVGISHCAVFDDGNDNWYYVSQQRYPADYPGINASNAIMLGGVRSIRWTEDGWPVVMPERYSGVAQPEIEEEDLYGEWENVTLSYSYGKMKESESMVLGRDHTVTSGWSKGKTWSFDPANNVLTIGTYKLYLQRETDWEASPRKTTIVYAGLNASSSSSTYWGKKVKGLEVEEAPSGKQIVGEQDFSSAWWTTFSDDYVIPANKTLTLTFVNHSSKAENWNNWSIVLTSDADRGAANYEEYFVLRADNFAWFKGDFNNNTGTNTSVKYTLNSNYSWFTFPDDMDGSTVVMTVSREGSTINVDADITSTTGSTFYESLSVKECGDGTQPVRAFLVCDGSWYEIDTEKTYVK